MRTNRRDEIIAIAAELMHSRGVRGTSVGDVLDAAGIGKGQFYHYFADKDALIAEVLAHNARKLEAAQAQLSWGLSSLDGVENWLRGIAAVMRARDCLRACPVGSVVAEVADNDDALRADIKRIAHDWRTRLRAALRGLKRKGELRADADAAALADFILVTAQGGMLMSKAVGSVAPLEQAIAQAMLHIRSFAPAVRATQRR
jgi:AcrR family transcriptional regulator